MHQLLQSTKLLFIGYLSTMYLLAANLIILRSGTIMGSCVEGLIPLCAACVFDSKASKSTQCYKIAIFETFL